MNSSRDIILANIRKAQESGATSGYAFELSKVETEATVFVQPSIDLIENFCVELEKISGKCYHITSTNCFADKLREVLAEYKINSLRCVDSQISKMLKNEGISVETDLSDLMVCEASITPCEFLISRTGSVMVSNGGETGRKLFVAPDVHIVLATENQVVADIPDALTAIQKKYSTLPSWVSNITGPSRTADIEKTLILGAHGPKKLIVFILKSFVNE